MSSSSSGTPISWSELPPELTSSIMLRLGVVEILESVQKVCRSWRRISKDPSIWRRIDMRVLGHREIVLKQMFDRFCRQAVDRSDGCLEEIILWKFANDSLLNYVADRSCDLRSLTLDMQYRITKEGIVNAVAKLPLLEELEISNFWSKLDLKAVGQSCPRLETLKLNCFRYFCSLDEGDDYYALSIAETLPELRHLQLIWNGLTDNGLSAILDNCLHLQYLDLRHCLYVKLVGDLEKRCIERIKDLRRPNDSTDDDCNNFVKFDYDISSVGDDWD